MKCRKIKARVEPQAPTACFLSYFLLDYYQTIFPLNPLIIFTLNNLSKKKTITNIL